MDRRQIEDAWTRLLDRQALTAQEQSDLHDQLSGRAELRVKLLNDGRIDRLLRSAAADVDEDAFVARLSKRLDALGWSDALPAFSEDAATAKSPPPVYQQELIATNRPDGIRSGRRPTLVPLYVVLASCAAVLMVVAAAAVVVSQRGKNGPDVVGQRVDQIQPRIPASPSIVLPPDQKVAETPAVPAEDIDDLQPAADATHPDAESPSPQRVVDAPPVTDPPIIARITGAENVVWQTDTQPQGELVAGSLYLSEGSAEITMAKGAVIRLAARVDLELVTADRVLLRRGNLTATVPGEAIGFEVRTPSSRVVDLGTEFEVYVDEQGATAVRVQQGKVEVSTTPIEGTGGRWQLDAGRFKWVSADARQSLDWRMVLTMADTTFGGALTVNGERIDFALPEEFSRMSKRVSQELFQLRRLAPPRADGSFRGEIDLNGERISIASARDAVRARQEVIRKFHKLWTDALGKMGGGSSTDGTININGEEFRIDSFDDLIKVQEEMLKRARDGFGLRPDAKPELPPDEKGRPIPKRADGAAIERVIEPVVDMIRSAEELVQLALRAELAGQAPQRDRLLALARTVDPEFPPARWHSGQVRVKASDAATEEWLPVAAAEKAAAIDPVGLEYDRQRDRHGDTVAGQEKMAKWCRSKGLEDQEMVHWAAVLKTQPTHAKARDRLGFKVYNGRLLTKEQITDIERQKAESNLLRRAWMPKLDEWRRAISSNDTAVASDARKQLHAVRDPRLVALLESSLSPRDEQLAKEVVAVLGKITDQSATESLVRHALLAKWPSVRSAAAQKLKPRSMYGYVPALIDAMHSPFEFESWVWQSPLRGEGAMAVDYIVARKGKNADYLLDGTVAISWNRIDDFGNPSNVTSDGAVSQATKQRAQDVQRDLEERVDRLNRQVERTNRPIREALAVATGQDFGSDPSDWNDWWNQYNEYAVPDYKPVVTNYQFAKTTAVARPYSCFPAGTLVRTQTGLRPIERLKTGDMVLSQDARTGELTYKPVLQRTVRDSDAIVQIALNGEVLQATKGHPIWVNGREWQMAKQLRPGDLLHGVDGPIEVEAVHEAPQRAVVYNLVVAEFNTYFVGETGVLVHDNSLYLPPGVPVPGHRLDVEHEREEPK